MSEAQPEKPADAWGQPISEERQRGLQGYLDKWAAETDHGERKGPFDGTELSGAEVFWLVRQSERDEDGSVPNLHLEGVNLSYAHLQRADLTGVRLEGANLFGAHLERAELFSAHLEGSDLTEAYLERTNLSDAHLEQALLNSAHLEGALLDSAHMERASLVAAHMTGGNLTGAHLEGASLTGADSERADLGSASFDKATSLNDAILTGALLDQATFDNTNLSVVDWRAVPRLGDEMAARTTRDSDGKRKSRGTRLDDYRAAVRANRRLAVALQANGLSDDASRYTYRAQLLQRASLLYEGRIVQYLGSWMLAGLAGYGYRPARTILLYAAILSAFAALYLNIGMVDGHAFNLTEAAVFSVTSFHGRGFFPGGLKLDDPVTVLAAIEAVIGLLIEISFIATFTQRFFNSR